MQISAVLPDVLAVLPSAGGCRQPEGKHSAPLFDSRSFLSPGFSRVSTHNPSCLILSYLMFLRWNFEFLDTFVFGSNAMDSLFSFLISG